MDDYLYSAKELLHRRHHFKIAFVTWTDTSMTHSPKSYVYFDKMLVLMTSITSSKTGLFAFFNSILANIHKYSSQPNQFSRAGKDTVVRPIWEVNSMSVCLIWQDTQMKQALVDIIGIFHKNR